MGGYRPVVISQGQIF